MSKNSTDRLLEEANAIDAEENESADGVVDVSDELRYLAQLPELDKRNREEKQKLKNQLKSAEDLNDKYLQMLKTHGINPDGTKIQAQPPSSTSSIPSSVFSSVTPSSTITFSSSSKVQATPITQVSSHPSPLTEDTFVTPSSKSATVVSSVTPSSSSPFTFDSTNFNQSEFELGKYGIRAEFLPNSISNKNAHIEIGCPICIDESDSCDGFELDNPDEEPPLPKRHKRHTKRHKCQRGHRHHHRSRNPRKHRHHRNRRHSHSRSRRNEEESSFTLDLSSDSIIDSSYSDYDSSSSYSSSYSSSESEDESWLRSESELNDSTSFLSFLESEPKSKSKSKSKSKPKQKAKAAPKINAGPRPARDILADFERFAAMKMEEMEMCVSGAARRPQRVNYNFDDAPTMLPPKPKAAPEYRNDVVDEVKAQFAAAMRREGILTAKAIREMIDRAANSILNGN